MIDRPLGVADLHADPPDLLLAWPVPQHWYWCRCHEQAHKVGEACGPCGGCIPANPGGDNSWPDGPPRYDEDCPAHGDHIDVGPFMSEDEANRLGSGPFHGEDYDFMLEPLGMEVK